MRLKALLSVSTAALLVWTPALAWVHGVGSGGGAPLVTPGASQPTINTSTRLVSATYNTITPASHGSAGDYGYAIRGGMRWDAIPYVEVGSVGVSGTLHVGFEAWHVPTATDLAAGLDSNISSAKVRCDSTGGANWFTISGPSVNPDAGGQTDWNFQVRSQDFPDGLHKCDLLISPATGPDIIADGPVSDPYGSFLETFKVSQAVISDGTGLNPGTVMTVFQALNPNNGDDITLLNWRGQLNTAPALAVGQSVSMMGSAANTFIASLGTGTGRQGTYNTTGGSQQAVGAKFTGAISGTTLTVSAVSAGNLQGANFIMGSGVTPVAIIGSADFNSGACSPACTGHAQTGTYALSGTTQTVASENMVASAPATIATARSFYFLTNYNGTLSRPVTYVSLSGSDSNGGTTYTSPFLTPAKAIAYLQANGTASGIYGGTVCLMGGGSFTYGTFTNRPWGTNGWETIQSANQAPCNAPGDPGGATVTNDSNSRSFFATHTMWRYLNFQGTADNNSGGDGQYLAADHVIQKNDVLGTAGILGQGGAYCVESTSWFGQDGMCSAAMLVRGGSAKYYVIDGQHDVAMSFGNSFDAGGNSLKWVTGTTAIGSNVVTGVSLSPAELSGRTLSSIFLGSIGLNVVPAGTTSEPGSACLSGAFPLHVSAVNDVSHTLTFLDSNNNPANATANCASGFFYAPGAHADDFQLQLGGGANNLFDDIYVAGNSWDATIQGWHQGLFLEAPQISGGYIANNFWNNDAGDTHKIMNVKGGNENLITSHNNFASTAGKDWNLQQGSVGDTLIQDQCAGGGFSIDTAGTSQRTKAAASAACYTTAP